MSRGGSRGTAGTLRRLAPRPKRRGRPAVYCLIHSGAAYLCAINPDRTAVLSPDPQDALRFPREVAGTVAIEMRERGWDAELVPAPKAEGWG